MVSRPSNLAARRTRLIGRDADLSTIRDLVLHGDGRLVTVTGAAGVGKTSVALEVARRLAPTMHDGAWFVELADVVDPGDVIEACIAAVGLLEPARPPVDALADFLAPRHALLCLDNCEHVVAAVAPLVDRLLDGAADLRIIATSRLPLRVRGEAVHKLAPMAPPGDDLDPAKLAVLPAVQLFVERARGTRSDFVLDDASARDIAAICRRLDGLPLAIELAASRVAVMTPAEIAHHLATDGTLGEAGLSGPHRHRTLDAAVGWSHRLLDPAEQVLFRRLSIFADGWSANAATIVCAPDDEPGAVTERLQVLADHSLIVHTSHDGRSRFRFLAPIGEYAGARLEAAGEREAFTAAHARWALSVAGHRGPGRVHLAPDDIALIDAEYDNVLAALLWAERTPAPDIAAGFIVALMEYWGHRGLMRLLRRHIEAVLGLIADGPATPQRSWLLTGLAVNAETRGDLDEARSLAVAAVVTAETVGDLRGLRAALGVIGNVEADTGNYAAARDAYRRVREVIDQAPNAYSLGFWHANMGSIAVREGLLDEAESLLEEARRQFLEVAPAWYLGQTLIQLATVARLRGDHRRAFAVLVESIEEIRRFRSIPPGIGCLEEAARLALAMGSPARAAILLGATSSLRDTTGFAPPAALREELDRLIDDLRSARPPEAFDTWWAQGRTLSFEAALDFAASIEVRAVPAPAGDEPPLGTNLTPREREVAELVAEGLSNAGIAERLAISPGTARIHVERVREKLGCTSRVQVAAWVLRHRGVGRTGARPSAERPLAT